MKDAQYKSVSVTASARKESCILKGERFVITVREKPNNNAANKRVCELIAAHFHLPVARVRIMSGHQKSSKRIAIIL